MLAEYEVSYQAYVEDLEKRKGPDADQPHRIAYKKLVRVRSQVGLSSPGFSPIRAWCREHLPRCRKHFLG